MRANPTAAGVLLFVLSMATLSLEIVQIRIFSYSLNSVFVYMVISLALLGFGLSGTVLSVVPRLRKADLLSALGLCHLLFALSAFGANCLFARASHWVGPEYGLSLISPVVPLFSVFAIPFFFSGLGIALVLLSDAERVNRNYGINLLASGVGCFAIYPFLQALGAERIVLAVALVCALSGTAVAAARGRRWLALGGPLCLLLLVSWFYPERVLPYQPDPDDLLANAATRIEEAEGKPARPKRLYTRWDPVGRVDVVKFRGPYRQFASTAPALLFAQDAGAGSILLGVGDSPKLAKQFAKGTSYGLPTRLRPDAEVLVIGIGGGPDLVASLAAGARRVTGVEINAAALEAVGGRYRNFLGLPPPDSKRLRLVHGDGRAYARQFKDHFDVIQMTGADTFAAVAASGSLFSENHLYTRESMVDLLDALKPDGVLAITRFGVEGVRALITAVAGLRDAGVERPLRHVLVLQQGPVWVTLLIKKTPFALRDLRRIRRHCLNSLTVAPRLTLPIYQVLGYRFDLPVVSIYNPWIPTGLLRGIEGVKYLYSEFYSLIVAIEDGTTEQWLAERELDFSAPTDDKPFFFHFPRLHWPSAREFLGLDTEARQLVWDLTQYVRLVFQVALLSLLLIVGPLLAFRRRGLSIGSAPPLGAFFFCIGAGFMLLEVGLMQKLSLFLGHPNHAIVTVLFSILVFSAFGSYSSSRLRYSARSVIRVASAAVLLCVVGFSYLSKDLFLSLLSLGIAARVAIAAAALAPLSFFMGMFFPVLLRRTEQTAPAFTPWAFGINGFASVLGSLATIPLTMVIGFTATLSIGAGAYALAWLLVELPAPGDWTRITRG